MVATMSTGVVSPALRKASKKADAAPMIVNEILIRRRNCVLLEAETFWSETDRGVRRKPRPEELLDDVYVATILKNLEAYGYTLSADAIGRLRTCSVAGAQGYFEAFVKAIRKLKGADKTFEPMYPNFPRQVMEASDAELYLNAILHYFGDWIGVRILPDYEKADRAPLFERTELTVLGAADWDDVHDVFANLMRSKTSISQADKDDLAWYGEEFAGNLRLPGEIPNKEVLAFVVKLFGLEALEGRLKTATDILRVAVALSDGDVSLAEKTKFRSFKRGERRFLLRQLDQLRSPISDMARHRAMWVRLGERVHPGEFQKKFPNAAEAFGVIRSGKRIETDRSKVEEALAKGDVLTALTLLVAKPGELARRLDHLLRICERTGSLNGPIVQAFQNVAEQVSVPVLLQLMSHLEHRDEGDMRVIFPKGNVAKVKALEGKLPPVDAEAAGELLEICRNALVTQFAQSSPLEESAKVYIDPALDNYVVPFSQRSASKALRTIVRGSRLPLDADKTLRFFIWWRDMDNGASDWDKTVDVDLSVVFFDSDWGYKYHVSYTSLRSAGVYHSGDITSAPRGACEFIDLDLKQVRKAGYRYALPSVLSYTRQPFIEMPECFFGWMAREQVQSGEIFEPKTVQQKLDLTAETKICIPCVFDLENMEMTWADIALRSESCFNNNVESNMPSLALMGKAMTALHKPSLGELFALHVKAKQAVLVGADEEPDVVFSVDQGVTPFDLDEIAGKWL